MNTHHQLLSSALHSCAPRRHSGGHCAVLAVFSAPAPDIVRASRGFCFAARCSMRCGARQVGAMRASELDTLPPCGQRPASITPRADAGSHRHTAAGRAGTRRGAFRASPRRGRTACARGNGTRLHRNSQETTKATSLGATMRWRRRDGGRCGFARTPLRMA